MNKIRPNQKEIRLKKRSFPLSRVFTIAAIMISILQGTFFSFEGPWLTANAIALCIAMATIAISWKYLTSSKTLFFKIVLFFLCLQFSIFVVKFFNTEPPFSFRLLQVAIIVFYLATILVALLTCLKMIEIQNAILLTCSIAIALLICEITLGFLLPPLTFFKGIEWAGTIESHPDLGMHYIPYSEIKTYYPDNPRGYFNEEDVKKKKWGLLVQKGSAANLVFPSGDTEMLRIAIDKAEKHIPWHIQLNQPLLKVRKNKNYSISFMARSDFLREISVGFAEAHGSWKNLGLYQNVVLTSDWQSFQYLFEATATDDNARIHFDLGISNISIELSDVILRSWPERNIVEPDIPVKYYVSYKFNALGCRGRDYPIPRSDYTTRIVCLGDSYTMGVGVHEEDTFAHQLERQLNEQVAASILEKDYDVINCGVSGYGTKEECLFYNLFASKYKADIVLLVMVSNDDRSFLNDVKMGYFYRPGKFDHLFYSWAIIQQHRYSRPFPDYSGCVEEILKLQNEVQKQGARLAVVIFDNFPETGRGNQYYDMWALLNDTITQRFQGTDIAILNLKEALFKDHSAEELFVHKSFDAHPNEIAHAIAAQEILQFLEKENLINSE